MKFSTTLAIAVMISAFGFGCTSSQIKKSSAMDILSPGLGLGGAMVGLMATEDEDLGTQMVGAGVGAAAGYLLGQFVENGFEDEKAKEFKSGYDLGRSTASKELYWNYQKMHEGKNDGNYRLKMFELPVLYPDDGINRVSDSVILPVIE